MSKIIFTDKTREVATMIEIQTDIMMGLMAAGIERRIKTSGKTPFLHGGLRSSVHSIKRGMKTYEVVADKNYAAAQEAGTVRGHRIVKYTTSGTGKGWFREAIEFTKLRSKEYAKTAAEAAGLRQI